jgi:hypothetical protein
VAAVGLSARAEAPVSRRRKALVALLAVGLAAALVPSFERNVNHRAFGGTKYPREASP